MAYEDPIPTTDIEGYVELCRALEVVRFIVDTVEGITGGMKLGSPAECFGLECAPHNWGDTLDHAVHFHCELAMPNNAFFEMTVPQGVLERSYMKDRIRIAQDGYVYAPTKPGLGYEIDRNVLDNLTRRVER